MWKPNPISQPYAEAICDILAEHCGLPVGGLGCGRDSLMWALTHEGITEFRFMGALGFGGKLWDNAGRWYVSCYRENENAARLAAITAANEKLAALRQRYDAKLPVNP